MWCCHLTIETGNIPPPMSQWPQLQYVLKGIKRRDSSTPHSTRTKWLPITAEIMSIIQSVLLTGASGLDQSNSLMLWAACCTGYFGFMRSGEFTSCQANQGSSTLQTSEVAMDSHSNPTVIRLFLRKAKTDPFGKGVYIYLGKTSKPVCLVMVLRKYLAIRPSHQGALFIWKDGSSHSQSQLVRELRQILKSANIDHSAYSGHSFRIGAVTSAARAGVPAHATKMLGRWESEAYILYIRTPRETLSSISTQIAP